MRTWFLFNIRKEENATLSQVKACAIACILFHYMQTLPSSPGLVVIALNKPIISVENISIFNEHLSKRTNSWIPLPLAGYTSRTRYTMVWFYLKFLNEKLSKLGDRWPGPYLPGCGPAEGVWDASRAGRNSLITICGNPLG